MRNLLNAVQTDWPAKLKGGTDAVIVSRAAALSDTVRTGLRLAIDLKTNVESRDVYQAVAELLAALSGGSEHRPMVLLTDLNLRYQFFWWREKEGEPRVVQIKRVDRHGAILILNHLMDVEGANSEVTRHFKDTSYERRDFMEMKVEESAVGQKRKQPSEGLLSLLPDMEPEEAAQWRLYELFKALQANPMFDEVIDPRAKPLLPTVMYS